MKQSELFTRTLKEISQDEVSLNAQLLERGGFVQKVMAGVYTFLPLGLRVLQNIEQIVREEMDRIGGQEVLMPALHPKENWQKTGRWEGFEALFKVISHFDTQYALGPTHEEIVVPMASKFIFSYKDLPFAVYQIQTKFRDEARSKSGLLRGREFRMKDLYSFHTTSEDLVRYYRIVSDAYLKIFKRLGLEALVVEASGGTFSKYSHEFQILAACGEDTIYHCSCGFAKNKEVFTGTTCPNCGKKLEVDQGIEVGNIFQLNTKYSDPFGLKYTAEDGTQKPVLMGCYGLGPSRIMGTIVEVSHDQQGMIWPESVAPFRVHLLELRTASGQGETSKAALAAYEALQKTGITVLYDDRDETAGVKFAESDLLGIPYRVIVSEKTVQQSKVELKKRSEKAARLVNIKELLRILGVR